MLMGALEYAAPKLPANPDKYAECVKRVLLGSPLDSTLFESISQRERKRQHTHSTHTNTHTRRSARGSGSAALMPDSLMICSLGTTI